MNEFPDLEVELAGIRTRAGGHYEVSVLVIGTDGSPQVPAAVGELLADADEGYTLGSLRQRIGGNTGHITGPDGKEYFLSLEPWKEADSDTRVMIRFRFVPRDRQLFSELVRDLIRRHRASP